MANIAMVGQVAKTVLGIGQSYAERVGAEADADYAISIYGANEILQKSANEFAVKRLQDRKNKEIASQAVVGIKNGAMFEGSRMHVATETIKEYNLDIFATKFKFKLQQFENSVATRQLSLQKKAAKTKFISDTIGSIFGLGSSALSSAGSKAGGFESTSSLKATYGYGTGGGNIAGYRNLGTIKGGNQ